MLDRFQNFVFPWSGLERKKEAVTVCKVRVVADSTVILFAAKGESDHSPAKWFVNRFVKELWNLNKHSLRKFPSLYIAFV